MNKKYLIIIAVLIYILLFLSCTNELAKGEDREEFSDFKEPKIVSISPQDGEKNVDAMQKISIKFSEPVDKKSAEQAFSLTSYNSGANTDGSFSWEGDKKIIFTPKYGWNSGEKYTVTIERTLKDKNRNKLQKKFESSFYIGDDFTHPTVSNITRNPYIQENDVVITIYFSRPMDIVSIQKALSISPSFNYRLTLDATGKILSIFANEKLNTMQEYTLTISQTAASSTGIPMLRDFIYEFAMYIDTVKPEILNIQRGNFNLQTFTLQGLVDLQDENITTNLIGKYDCIAIRFNEPMDRQSVEMAFNISPELSKHIYWLQQEGTTGLNDIFIFNPDDGYIQDKIYSFFLDSTAKDIVGNTIDRKTNKYNLVLSTIPPTISRIVFNENLASQISLPPAGNDPDYIINYNDILQPVLINDYGLNPPGYDSGSVQLVLYFDNFDYILPDSLYSNIKVSFYSGNAFGNYPFVYYDLIDTVTNRYIITVHNLCLSQNPLDPQNTYILEITGGPNGIRTSNGIYMENTKKIYFKVTGLNP